MTATPQAFYEVRDISDWPEFSEEPQGGKKKCWLLEPLTLAPSASGLSSPSRHAKERRWLFKDRAQGGDDWAERVAQEVAQALKLPCSEVVLVERAGVLGMMSLDFTDNRSHGDLVLGNELLLEMDPQYPSGRRFRFGAHTVDKVVGALRDSEIGLPASLQGQLATAAELFVGYLLLDVLIGNTDRHHENWGILRHPTLERPRWATLAPSFDHAASLGQILQDSERVQRLSTRDVSYTVAAYSSKARSALFSREGDKRPLLLMEALLAAGRLLSHGATFWQSALSEVSQHFLDRCVDKVPAKMASEPAKRFAKAMLAVNRQKILEVQF